MNIAIDGTIIREEITGTGFYITNLINGLVKIDNLNSYYIFGDEENLKRYINREDKKNFKIIHKRFKNRILRVLWEFFIFPLELKKLKIEILHSPNYITPLLKLGFKVILTIHDLTFLLFAEQYPLTKRFLFGKMINIYIKISDKIIAVSENSKKDILQFFNIPDNKISVTFESYPEYYNNHIDEKRAIEVLKKHGIQKGFILYVGMIEPRKNILSLLKAFVELDKELDLDLVIVGKKGWYYKEIERFVLGIETLELNNSIIFTGYIAEEELKYFYKSAFMFVYPSLYEGFGLPPLQAMACGTPVITSSVSSLPEVVGDAAIKINPDNLDELVESIKLVYSDKYFRDLLIKKGLDRSKLFNLEIIAQNTLSIYESIK
ncbi:MAG: glycosyltransferase family 4 protein [Nitrososphaeraceae archaeon]